MTSLTIYPKAEPEPPKRQWYVSEYGEYECPHFEVIRERSCTGDKPVDLTDEEAENLREIGSLWLSAQNFLDTLYYGRT